MLPSEVATCGSVMSDQVASAAPRTSREIGGPAVAASIVICALAGVTGGAGVDVPGTPAGATLPAAPPQPATNDKIARSAIPQTRIECALMRARRLPSRL